MPTIFGTTMKVHNFTHQRLIRNYNSSHFDFATFFTDLLSVDERQIEQLHKHRPDLLPASVIDVENDQNQKVYELLYQVDSGYGIKRDFDRTSCSEDGFLGTYHRFIDWLANELFEENLVYQARPTLRVSFPGNKAVGDWHRDSDYNHPTEEINVWVPLTNTNENNTIWIESCPDLADYEPMAVNYGEFLLFDGILKHGNVINISSSTRLSFDFRVIPVSKYMSIDKRSYSRGLQFSVGDYYAQTTLFFS